MFGCRTETRTLHRVREANVVRVESTGNDVIDVSVHVRARTQRVCVYACVYFGESVCACVYV